MTTEQSRQYAQDESKKRFGDESWDRNTRDESWRERVDASRAELEAEGKVFTTKPLIKSVRSVTIQSPRYAEMLAFYRDFIGCEVKYDIEVKNANPPMRQATLIAPGDFAINITGRGIERPVPEDRWVPAIRLTFQVEDRDEARARIDQFGVREYDPEFQGPYGPVFTVMDPDNNLINLLCPKYAELPTATKRD